MESSGGGRHGGMPGRMREVGGVGRAQRPTLPPTMTIMFGLRTSVAIERGSREGDQAKRRGRVGGIA